MIRELPENGYESPLPSPHGGSEFFSRPRLIREERIRVAYTRESLEVPVESDGRTVQTGSTNGIINGGIEGNQQLEAVEEKPRRVGFRDRLGCYTWTWFTMTMATGGIANVLHSSMALHLRCEVLSDNSSSVQVRLAADPRRDRLLLQPLAVRHELHLSDTAIPLERRVSGELVPESVGVLVYPCLCEFVHLLIKQGGADCISRSSRKRLPCTIRAS